MMQAQPRDNMTGNRRSRPISTALLAFIMLALQCPLLFGSDAQPATSGKVILDMDSVRHRPGEVKNKDQQTVPVGTVELVEGKFGKAVRFYFAGDLGAGFMTASVPTTPEWDQADGFSFYVKGDGSTNWGGIELIDKDDFALRYAYCFPIDSTDWRQIVVPWRGLIPELAGPLINPQTGYAPSHFGNLWFGKWFYWRDYPAHAFAIDQIALEGKIVSKVESGPVATGLKLIRSKLKAQRPITLVTMGDSLSDKRHWANRETLWSEQLGQQLQEKCGCAVTLVNPAIGGTTLSQNLILMPRWLHDTPRPDLVTVWFGFNDWDSGVRGPRFKDYLRLAVDRIRRETGGASDILLLTTCPAYSRWETMKELEQATMEVAQEKGVAVADIAAEFRRMGSAEQALQQSYLAWDKTHLGTNGHRLVAATVMKALTAAE